MIAAVHAIIGASLGRLYRTPARAALAGAVSHVAADMMPHRDLDIPQEAALLGAALSLIASVRGASSPEFWGAIGAVAPDIENLVGRLRGWPDEALLLPNHNRCHGREANGFAAQVALAALGLAILALPQRT